MSKRVMRRIVGLGAVVGLGALRTEAQVAVTNYVDFSAQATTMSGWLATSAAVIIAGVLLFLVIKAVRKTGGAVFGR